VYFYLRVWMNWKKYVFVFWSTFDVANTTKGLGNDNAKTFLPHFISRFCLKGPTFERTTIWSSQIFEGLFFRQDISFIHIIPYRSCWVCYSFRLTKRYDYFWVTFHHFWSKCHFWTNWEFTENRLEPKTKPSSIILTKST